MLKFRFVAVLTLGLAMAGVAGAAPISKHALPKAFKAVAKAAVVAPKATAVALKDTLGGVLFAAEGVVDVIHAGTTAINTVASKELKHNPFSYVDEYVGKADNGLEKAYEFFFHAQI